MHRRPVMFQYSKKQRPVSKRKRRLQLESLESRQMLDGMTIVETPLIQDGDDARVLIPTVANGGDSLGDTWHGGNEPFDDSIAAGWIHSPTSIGYGQLQPPLSVAGELFVDLDASDVTAGTATWINNGTLGDFVEVNDPIFQIIDGVPAVSFDGVDDAYQSPTSAPAGLVGINPTRSIEVWVHNPSIPSEETLIAWGKRGGVDGTKYEFQLWYQ